MKHFMAHKQSITNLDNWGTEFIFSYFIYFCCAETLWPFEEHPPLSPLPHLSSLFSRFSHVSALALKPFISLTPCPFIQWINISWSCLHTY